MRQYRRVAGVRSRTPVPWPDARPREGLARFSLNAYRLGNGSPGPSSSPWLARAIDQARGRWDFDLWAYVFMPERVHLIVRPRGPDSRVAAVLKAVKQPVGRRALLYLEAQAPRWLARLSRERNGRVERLFWQPGGGYVKFR